jgi:putative oxidoreductase
MNASSSFPLAAIRWIVGCLFILVGILKWTIGDFRVGFEQIGLPYPQVTVLLVGGVEWVCGSLLLFNLHVRKAAVSLMVIMLGALLLTKLPLLSSSSLWKVAFESKLDLLLFAFLFVLWKEYKHTA